MNRLSGICKKYYRHGECAIDQEPAKQVTSESSEAELLAALRAEGETALADYFMRNRARLHRMITMRMDHRLAQRVDASDVLQEGFVDTAKRLNEYLENPSMPLFVWMRFLVGQKLAAVHRWHFKTQKRDPRREEVAATQRIPAADSQVIAQEFTASITSPSEAFSKAETTQQMLEALETLEPLDREILVMRHFEELSNNEAAAELQITKGTASKRYVRALAKLNKAMSSMGGAIPSVREN